MEKSYLVDEIILTPLFFQDLTKNQKLSITTYLKKIIIYDTGNDNSFPSKGVEYFEEFCKDFDITEKECDVYSRKRGAEYLLEDLRSLSEFNKNLLLISTIELVEQNSEPNKKRQYYIEQWLKDLDFKNVDYLSANQIVT